jgi:prepilin-type N-terminal cleavage/methylation domain-containing protein
MLINMALLLKIRKKNKPTLNNKGMSLLEVIVAAAIFSVIGVAIITLAVGGFSALQRGGDQTEAEALAQEGVEAIRSIRDGAWNEIFYDKNGVAVSSQSAVEILSSQWELTGEGTIETIGQYTRTITISDVCRDILDDITNCPGNYKDLHSKKIKSEVIWSPMNGVTSSVERISYLTNWDSVFWREDLTADFSNGSFSNTVEDGTVGDADGAIILQAL